MRPFFIMSKYTFLELYRSRIMQGSFLIGLFLLTIILISSELTYGVPKRMALDLGLGLGQFASVLIAIFLGSGIIAKEIEERRTFMILTRPISRNSYFLGRLFGLFLSQSTFFFVIFFFSMSSYVYLGGEFSPAIFQAITLGFIESAIVLTLVVLLSLITKRTLAIFYTIALYISSYALSETLLIRTVKEDPFVFKVITFLTFILPNFSKLNLRDHMLYEQMPSLEKVSLYGLQGVLYLAILIILTSKIFSTKDLD